MVKKKNWSYGDTKKDRKGKVIYFVGYSTELSKKGHPIEMWVQENEYLKLANKD